jgi:hypothetical protein
VTRIEIWRLVSSESKSPMVSQSGIRTGGGATTSDACGTIAEVASGSS